jgi:hypothetical protein
LLVRDFFSFVFILSTFFSPSIFSNRFFLLFSSNTGLSQ